MLFLWSWILISWDLFDHVINFGFTSQLTIMYALFNRDYIKAIKWFIFEHLRPVNFCCCKTPVHNLEEHQNPTYYSILWSHMWYFCLLSTDKIPIQQEEKFLNHFHYMAWFVYCKVATKTKSKIKRTLWKVYTESCWSESKPDRSHLQKTPDAKTFVSPACKF